MSLPTRFRLFTRALHTSRPLRAAQEPGSSYYNEPGGRLFGEAIRKPGQRRELFDWEVPYIGTLVLTGLILSFGLNSRPETSVGLWAKEEAISRVEARKGKDASEEGE